MIYKCELGAYQASECIAEILNVGVCTFVRSFPRLLVLAVNKPDSNPAILFLQHSVKKTWKKSSHKHFRIHDETECY